MAMPWFHRTCAPRAVLRMIVASAWTIFRLGGIMLRTRASIVHANSGVAALAACLPAAILRRSLVWHQHDVVPNRPINRLVLGACSRLSAGVVCTSRTVAESLRELGIPGEKLRVVHPRVRREFGTSMANRADCRHELGLPADSTVMTIVGRLVPRKGHRTFLEAASLLAREGIDVHAVVLGSGQETPGSAIAPNSYVRELEEIARQPELQGRVTFLPHRDDVQSVLAASDILVVPSPFEPFGIITLEAFAVGVPVVASNKGGPAEVIEHEASGLLVPAGDAPRFASAIRLLVEHDDLRKSLVDEARRQVAVRFSEESLAPALDRLYSELLASSQEAIDAWSAHKGERAPL